MKNICKSITKIIKYLILSLAAFVLIVIPLFFSFGLVINTTKSMPLGLYKKVDGPLVKGDLVMLKVPTINEYLIKKIAATKGDLIEINSNGVYINNILQTNTKIFKYDTFNQPLHFNQLKTILKDNEFIALGEHIRSYDSRYFGIVKQYENNIKKLIKIITF
ncbi:S26 family signal peptidase [Campylobacter sp. RM12640]|uniref:S26 family signal peptidase n=1 Tax=unclassified Campylobacter TaxID=2593542 RepID=UPI001DE3DE1E|nr:S26 family signal peptidase [Campylobacter sp. RM12642]MBZ7982442.1 S26 family signal peptidase [Campylobacter sp. RM12640]MBZ7990097.1 S26 family signal peptidase [Campylobacter sp. RM12635]MBZ8008240.1 S26 family signal peptidase [Campylobacter sp. RM9334]